MTSRRMAVSVGIMALGLLFSVRAFSIGVAGKLPCTDSTETLCGDGGPAVAARLLRPLGIAANPAGGFFVADAGNDAVRAVSASGVIRTVAGLGTRGYSGDNGAAVGAELDGPADVSVVPNGGLLIADTGNNVIRRISAKGKITTVAGRAPGASVQRPSATPTPATNVDLVAPEGVAALDDGGYLIADTGANLVLRVSAQGLLTVVAGTGVAGYSGDGKPATSARLRSPTRLVPTPDGGFLVLDIGNGVVRFVSAGGVISTVHGTSTSTDQGLFGQLALNPGGLARDSSGDLFVFADRSVIEVSRNGTRTVIAGTGDCGSTGDGGPALSATFVTPTDLALDRDGNLLVVDWNDGGSATGDVRLIDLHTGAISTVAGKAGDSSACVGAGGAPSGALWPIFYITAPQQARAYRAIKIQFLSTHGFAVRTSLLAHGRRVRSIVREGKKGPNTVTLKRGVAAGTYTMEIQSTGEVKNNIADSPDEMLTLSKRYRAALRVRR